MVWYVSEVRRTETNDTRADIMMNDTCAFTLSRLARRPKRIEVLFSCDGLVWPLPQPGPPQALPLVLQYVAALYEKSVNNAKRPTGTRTCVLDPGPRVDVTHNIILRSGVPSHLGRY